jgi:hypothetical protein
MTPQELQDQEQTSRFCNREHVFAHMKSWKIFATAA